MNEELTYRQIILYADEKKARTPRNCLDKVRQTLKNKVKDL
jgi:hypothetical protein